MDPGLEVEKMDEFKTYKINYINDNATWIDFIKMFPGVIEDKAKQVNLTYNNNVCSVKFSVHGTIYIISLTSGLEFKSRNLEEIWRRFLQDWQQFGVGVGGAPSPAYHSSPAPAPMPPPMPAPMSASMGYNSSNVIGMLYELRNMHRNMHDGARTLR